MKKDMHPGGFEPTTPWLQTRCSDRTELWMRDFSSKFYFLRVSENFILRKKLLKNLMSASLILTWMLFL